nr:NAD(P)H-binding protein [Planococcus glaciei]
MQTTKLDYTIIRPGALSNEDKSGKIEVSSEGFTSMEGRSIPRADVAAVLVKALDQPNTHHKIFEVLQGDTPLEEELNNL